MIFEKLPGPKAMAIIKLQALSVLILAVIFFSGFIPETAIIAIELALAALFVFVLFFDARKKFGKEFLPVALFFGFLIAIIIASLAIQAIPMGEINLRFQLLIAISIMAAVFFLAYRLFFSRNCLEATVVSAKRDSAVVETGFDFLAGINAGKYFVKAAKNYPAGKKVRVKITRSFFGRKPTEIIE